MTRVTGNEASSLRAGVNISIPLLRRPQSGGLFREPVNILRLQQVVYCCRDTYAYMGRAGMGTDGVGIAEWGMDGMGTAGMVWLVWYGDSWCVVT